MPTARLDSREEIKKFDKSNLLGSIEQLPSQIEDAWAAANLVAIPAEYKTAKNVVISGMGGSALGSYVIKHLYKSELTVPFEIYSGYDLPEYVNEDSLVLLSSYSGTTEETLSAAHQAIQRKAKVMVICSGGPLAALAKEHNFPAYIIDPKHNPSNQPRMAIGYTIVGQLALFHAAGILQVNMQEVERAAEGLRKLVTKLQPESLTENAAKELAYACFDKHVIFSAVEHLIGAAHVMNNQMNENAKTLTSEWHLPEFNHHYLEALSHPKSTQDSTIFLLFGSNLVNPHVAKRVPLTQAVIENAGYQAELIQAAAPTKLEQIFEIIQLGSFVGFYLAMLYSIDPAPIPNVDWFKAEMAKL